MTEAKSIEQLESDYWKDIKFPSELVKKCFDFRKIPIKNLSIGQVRLLLGQKIGVEYLLPKAVNFLRVDILAEGDYYPGDLLTFILGLNESDWNGNRELQQELESLLAANKSKLEFCNDKGLLKQVEEYLLRST